MTKRGESGWHREKDKPSYWSGLERAQGSVGYEVKFRCYWVVYQDSETNGSWSRWYEGRYRHCVESEPVSPVKWNGREKAGTLWRGITVPEQQGTLHSLHFLCSRYPNLFPHACIQVSPTFLHALTSFTFVPLYTCMPFITAVSKLQLHCQRMKISHGNPRRSATAVWTCWRWKM